MSDFKFWSIFTIIFVAAIIMLGNLISNAEQECTEKGGILVLTVGHSPTCIDSNAVIVK